MSQLFSLKWKNHRAILNELKYFLMTEAMVDVTLACDGQRLKAHKIILAACSPYFKSLFLENPCQHPIVLLKGVKYAELKAIIEFMYSGEVKVSEKDVTALLETAETLKIKGLTQISDRELSENDQLEVESESRHANETENIDDVESSHGVTYSIDLSECTLTRKQSADDLNDGQTCELEIKQEPLSNDTDFSAPCSTDSKVALHIPSLNPFHDDDDLPEHPGEQISDQNRRCKKSLESYTLNVTKDNLPSQSFQSPVPFNGEYHESNTEQTCLPVLSSTTENPVASIYVISDSDILVMNNQQPKSDSSSEKVQSKMELFSEKVQSNLDVKRSSKKSIKTSHNLEKQKSQRCSLRQEKKEKYDNKLLDSSSKSPPEIPTSILSDVPKEIIHSTPLSSDVSKGFITNNQHSTPLSSDVSKGFITDNQHSTPANVNKKNEKVMLDLLIAHSLPLEEIKIVQCDDNPLKRKREQEILEINSHNTKKILKNTMLAQKEQKNKIFEKIKGQTVKEKNEEMICCKCAMLESKIDILLKENVNNRKEIEELKNLELEYKNFKNSSNNDTVSTDLTTLDSNQLIVLGPTLSIDSYKLNCCRSSDFSKFTGDLLDLVFGPEVLGTSVLKGIAGCKKISVLNPDSVRDIQMYVATKFNVPPREVRYAIRQKLNACHKLYKKMNENMFNIIE